MRAIEHDLLRIYEHRETAGVGANVMQLFTVLLVQCTCFRFVADASIKWWASFMHFMGWSRSDRERTHLKMPPPPPSTRSRWLFSVCLSTKSSRARVICSSHRLCCSTSIGQTVCVWFTTAGIPCVNVRGSRCTEEMPESFWVGRCERIEVNTAHVCVYMLHETQFCTNELCWLQLNLHLYYSA